MKSPFPLFAFIVFLPMGSLTATDTRVPVLPEIPADYDAESLPEHFLINAFPPGNPFQNAVVDNDNTPPDNPTTDDGATLGRVLFYDRKLSANSTVSCASCHLQENGFSDPAVFSVGFEGGLTRRNSMGLANARFYEPGKFFWDERAETLEDQVLMPFQDEVEMGLTLAQLEALVAGQDYYPKLFTHAFGDPEITADRIAKALAQFVRSMVSVNSRYDQGRALVDTPLADFPNFTAAENRGKQLFMDRGNSGEPGGPVSCVDCHVSEAFISPFRGTSHDSGTSAATNNGLNRVSPATDQGIAEATGNVADTGKFKVPSLRNVALTEPYMHDGRFSDLNEVLNFYDGNIENHAQLAEILIGANGRPIQFNLTGDQRSDIVAFLETLTDEAFITDEKFSDPFVAAADIPPSNHTRATNLSTRSLVTSGEGVLILGFVVAGSGTKDLLIRGVGPTLEDFGVGDPLSAPRLTLYQDATVIAANEAWTQAENPAAIAAMAETIGAFPLRADGSDSALLATVAPGAYTIHLSGAHGSVGEGLVEIYDTGGDPEAKLVNLSARAEISPASAALIPGFVVSGDAAKTYLIRAVGPALADFNVTGAMSDPQLTLYRNGELVSMNDDWSDAGNAAQTEATASALGAFALPADSADAAITIALVPGAYTVHVTGVDGSAGSVLVEIYEVP
jgi:cytochrome c peroxidase